MRSGHDHGILTERIEHHDLAVNVNAGSKRLLHKIMKDVLDVLGHHRFEAEVLRRLSAAAEQRDRRAG